MYIQNRSANQATVGEAINMDPPQSVYDENSPFGGLETVWDQKRRNSQIDFYTQYIQNPDFPDSKFDIMGGYSWQHYWREGTYTAHRISRFEINGDPVDISGSSMENDRREFECGE